MTGLSFLVTSYDQKEVLHFSEKLFETQYTPQDILVVLNTEIEKETLLRQCAEIVVIYSNSTYTLVPAEFFDEKKLSEYLKFNSKILLGDFIAFDEVSNHDIRVVYVPLVNINNYFFETYGSFKYYHAITVLLEHVLQDHPTSPKVFIHITKDHIDLVAAEKGTVQLANSYPYKTPEDLIYYVLFAFEQLQWNPDSVPATALGTISEEDVNFTILYKYIRNVSIDNLPSAITIKGLAPQEQFLLKNS